MANVKITALTDIGANILYTALIPMVNMAGTPTTEKGNIQILGNYILSGAGSANFAPAALSNLSYSVVNAAQPNITSVGTLTSLSVTGNITSGEYVTADFFVGDGGFLTNVSSAGTSIANGTSNISIPAAGGNILFTRGGIANILVVNANGANVAGTLTTANLNVTGNVTSNLLPNANVTFDLGSATQRWKDLWLSNSTIYIGNSTISAGTSNSVVFSGSVQADGNITANTNSNVTIRTVTGNASSFTWSFGADGNLTLPNNTFAVNYANGSPVQLGGNGGLPLANGTSNFNIAAADGSATITANGTHTWAFDDTGNLILPGNTFAVNYANGDPIVLGGNSIGNFVVSGNMFMLNDPNVDMVIQQSATDMTSIRLIPNGPDSGVHVETGAMPTMWHWHFEDTGNFYAPGNVVMDGTKIQVGPGADQLANVANATLAISSNSSAYLQAIINNVSDVGSADWIAQGHYGDDNGGYVDLGFNSVAYNDPTYDIAGPGDGYVFVEGYFTGQAPINGGGNLVLASGDQGDYRDLIFGVGGFTSANMFAKMSDANGAFEIVRPGAYIQLPDGSVLDAGGLYGNDTAILSNGSGAVQAYAQSTGFGIQTGDGNATINTWTFGNDGSLTAPNNSNIYPAGNNFNIFAPAAGAIQFYTDSGNYSWSLDSYGTMNLPLDASASNTASMYAAGNLRFNAAANSFVFTDTGAFVFPTMTVDLHNGGNQYAQTLQFGDASQQAVITGPTPAPDTAAQRLIIQGQRGNGLGEGGDVYLWAGDANTNGGDIKIYAGDADDPASGSGGYINLDAGSGFSGGGQLTLTGGYSAGGQGGPIYISAGQGVDGGVVNVVGGGASANNGGYVNIQGGFGQNDGGAVTIAGGGSALGLANYGNVQITAGVSTWTFDNAGDLRLAAGNSVISSLPNNAGDGSGLSTLNLYPDSSTVDDRYLILDPTGPAHLHLRAGGNIDSSNVLLYLGGEQTYVQVDDGYHRVSINSYDIGNATGYNWRFDYDGNLVLPGNTFAVNYANGTPVSLGGGLPLTNGTSNIDIASANGNVTINSNGNIWTFTTTGDLQLASGAVLSPSGANGLFIQSGDYAIDYAYSALSGSGQSYQAYVENDQSANSAWAGFTALLTSNNTPTFTIETQKAIDGVNNQWIFDYSGNLSVPGSITDANRINANIYETNVITYASLPAASVAGLRSFINDANLVAAGNFGVAVSGGGSNTVPVYSDGSDWRIG